MNSIKLSLDQISKKFGNNKFIGKYTDKNENENENNLNNDFIIQLLPDNDQFNFYRCILSQISNEYQFAFTNDLKFTILKDFIDKLMKYIYSVQRSSGNKYINNISTCNFNTITPDILNDIYQCFNINIIIIKDETIESFTKKYNNIVNFSLERFDYVSNSNINNNNDIYLCIELNNNIYLPIIFKDNSKKKDLINYISN